MPVGEYYKGSGRRVMADMQARYGEESGKRVFYATAAKRPGMNRPSKPKRKRGKARRKGGGK